MSTVSIFKKPETLIKKYRPSIHPNACNPIYRTKIRVECPLCYKMNGRPHIFKTLWQLFTHSAYHHKNESNWKFEIKKIAAKVMQGKFQR